MRVLAGLAALFCAAQALAQSPAPAAGTVEPPRQPFLQIETGFHTAPVNSVALAANAPVLVTGSSDKTIRVWNSDDGLLQSTIRVPLAQGLEGAIRAVAVSPDGKTIVAGGYTGVTSTLCLYLIDAERGEIAKSVKIPGLAASIAFAPSGDKFAVAMTPSSATARAGLALLGREGNLLTYDQEINGPVSVAFANDGRFGAVTIDGTVRVYGPDGRPRATRKLAGTGRPNSIAFSPSGDFLAVGFDGSVRVEVLASLDLATRVTPDVAGIATGDLANVAFVVDGGATFLIAGGAINNQEGDAFVYAWSEVGLGPRKVVAKARNTVMAIAAGLTGKIAIGTADPSLMIVNRGRVASLLTGATIDFRYVTRGRLATDMTGSKFLFSTDKGQPLELVDIPARAVREYPAEKYAGVQWFDPLAKATTAQVTSWRISNQTKVANKPVQFQPGERSLSADVNSDGLIALGTDYRVRLFTATGEELRSRPTSTPVYGVTFSGNGQRLVAALGDGTLRVYDIRKDGLSPLKVAMFVHKSRRSWVAWLPEGFFDHSEHNGGEDLVGYALNRAAGKSPEWLTFSQLYKTLYAPSLVEKRLMSDAQGEPEIEGRFAGLGDIRQQYEKAVPPVVALTEICFDEGSAKVCKSVEELSAASKAAAGGTTGIANGQQPIPIVLAADVTKARLHYTVAPREGGVGNFDLMVNDTNKGRSRLRAAALRTERFVEREVAIDGNAATVTARVYDNSDTIFAEAQPISIRNTTPVVERSTKADLYVLAVGINDYPEGSAWFRLNGKPRGYGPLGLAKPDAESFAHTVEERGESLYRKVFVTTLRDRQATAPALTEALTDIAKRAGPDDTVLIYLAGHGDKVAVGDQKYDFMFITADVDIAGSAAKTGKAPLGADTTNQEIQTRVYADAFKGKDLVQLLSQIRSANVMVFLDTCHSGTVNLFSRDLDAVGSLNAEAGRYVLAATAEDEAELDSYDGKAGVFATAVLRGLRGHRSIQRDPRGVIDQLTLGLYVQDTLPGLVQEANAKLPKEQQVEHNARFMVATRNAIKFPLTRPPASEK